GIYFWNNGSQQLRIYERTAGNWAQLGPSYNSGPLAAGTTLTLQAIGSTLTLLQNGIQRITVTDTTLTNGAPAIYSYGAATADNWSAGTATPPSGPPGFQAQYQGTDSDGVVSYAATSTDNGYGSPLMRCP